MRILGIDTSLTGTGLARLDFTPDGSTLEVCSVAAPKPGKDKSKRAMVRRVDALLTQIEGCFIDDRPDAVGIEGLAYSAGNASAWVLAWVWGDTIRLCERYDVPLTVVATSARAKYATGKGNAPKDAVLAAAIKLFPYADIGDNNEADAAIVAAVVAHQRGMPIVPVTSYRDEVLIKLGE